MTPIIKIGRNLQSDSIIYTSFLCVYRIITKGLPPGSTMSSSSQLIQACGASSDRHIFHIVGKYIG